MYMYVYMCLNFMRSSKRAENRQDSRKADWWFAERYNRAARCIIREKAGAASVLDASQSKYQFYDVCGYVSLTAMRPIARGIVDRLQLRDEFDLSLPIFKRESNLALEHRVHYFFKQTIYMIAFS